MQTASLLLEQRPSPAILKKPWPAASTINSPTYETGPWERNCLRNVRIPMSSMGKPNRFPSEFLQDKKMNAYMCTVWAAGTTVRRTKK